MVAGPPPYPTETMVRILILKRLHNLSDEQIEYQLMDRMSYPRFIELTHCASIPDRNTVWVFESRIGLEGATALIEAVQKQLVPHGYIARCGQLIDAPLVPDPKQYFSKEDKEILEQDDVPAYWSPAKRRKKDLGASWTKKHGKSHHGYKLIRKIEMSEASVHDSRDFDAVLDPANANRAVNADKGNASAERKQALREAGYRDRNQSKGGAQPSLVEATGATQ